MYLLYGYLDASGNHHCCREPHVVPAVCSEQSAANLQAEVPAPRDFVDCRFFLQFPRRCLYYPRVCAWALLLLRVKSRQIMAECALRRFRRLQWLGSDAVPKLGADGKQIVETGVPQFVIEDGKCELLDDSFWRSILVQGTIAHIVSALVARSRIPSLFWVGGDIPSVPRLLWCI